MKAEPPEDWEICLYFWAAALHPSPEASCAVGDGFSTESGFLKFLLDLNCKQNVNAIWLMWS